MYIILKTSCAVNGDGMNRNTISPQIYTRYLVSRFHAYSWLHCTIRERADPVASLRIKKTIGILVVGKCAV